MDLEILGTRLLFTKKSAFPEFLGKHDQLVSNQNKKCMSSTGIHPKFLPDVYIDRIFLKWDVFFEIRNNKEIADRQWQLLLSQLDDSINKWIPFQNPDWF